jgi:hypothetical protein
MTIFVEHTTRVGVITTRMSIWFGQQVRNSTKLHMIYMKYIYVLTLICWLILCFCSELSLWFDIMFLFRTLWVDIMFLFRT